MTDDEERIYDSAPSEPDDDFWLEQGRKMLEGSLGAVRDAAKSLITGLGLLKGIYLAILGFADPVSATARVSAVYAAKIAFAAPLLFWAVALYFCIEVMMTRRADINLRSPDDIRRNHQAMLQEKQGSLRIAFGLLAFGLLVAIAMMVISADM